MYSFPFSRSSSLASRARSLSTHHARGLRLARARAHAHTHTRTHRYRLMIGRARCLTRTRCAQRIFQRSRRSRWRSTRLKPGWLCWERGLLPARGHGHDMQKSLGLLPARGHGHDMQKRVLAEDRHVCNQEPVFCLCRVTCKYDYAVNMTWHQNPAVSTFSSK